MIVHSLRLVIVKKCSQKIDTYDALTFYDFFSDIIWKIAGMVKNRSLARAISRAGWRQISTLCEAKSHTISGREVRTISRWEPTSQTCSDCGFRWGKLELSIRSVLCISCGAEHDRDQNAAKNINIVGAGLAHDAKRTRRARKSSLLAMPIETSSHKVAQQLSLYA